MEDKRQRDLGLRGYGACTLHGFVEELPKVVEFDFGNAEVVRADTVFQVREALLDAERSKGRIILLTKLRQGDLGNDVVARLARSRLFAIDHWASLCSLFKAKELDPSICDASLAEALLECAPADGYPPVSAGVLDAGTSVAGTANCASCVRDGGAGTGPGMMYHAVGDEQGDFFPLFERQRRTAG